MRFPALNASEEHLLLTELEVTGLLTLSVLLFYKVKNKNKKHTTQCSINGAGQDAARHVLRDWSLVLWC